MKVKDSNFELQGELAVRHLGPYGPFLELLFM